MNFYYALKRIIPDKIVLLMKKFNISQNTLHLVLLVSILILLFLSYFSPWAVGKTFVSKTTIYVSDIKPLGFVLILIGLVVVILYFYSIITGKLFSTGISWFITGGITICLCCYILNRIKHNEINLLGMEHLRLVSAGPAIGLILLFLAGILMVLTGLIYLIKR